MFLNYNQIWIRTLTPPTLANPLCVESVWPSTGRLSSTTCARNAISSLKRDGPKVEEQTPPQIVTDKIFEVPQAELITEIKLQQQVALLARQNQMLELHKEDWSSRIRLQVRFHFL